MKEIFPRAFLSRRAFLQKAAASSTVAFAAPRLPGFVTASLGASLPHRIGLLMPAFPTHPQVGANFVDGLSLFLSQQGALGALRLFTADACSHAGISAAEVATICEEEALDVVVSMANPGAIGDVWAALEEASMPLVISHAGANRVDSVEPNVFYNSLGYWQASYRAGAWAAEALGSGAAVVSSFYESGYDALYAFERGLTENGGFVRKRYVTQTPGHPVTMGEVVSDIAASGADFVYGHLSGESSAAFLTAYRSSRRTRHLPLLGATFLTADDAPGAAGAMRDARSVGSWSALLQRTENVVFCRAFEARYGRRADSFAVLGYDTAGLLAAAAMEAQDRGVSLGVALQQAQFEGPRGRLVMDAATQTVTPPLYLRQMAWQGSAYDSNIVAALAPVVEEVARATVVRSGWIHPYLSI